MCFTFICLFSFVEMTSTSRKCRAEETTVLVMPGRITRSANRLLRSSKTQCSKLFALQDQSQRKKKMKKKAEGTAAEAENKKIDEDTRFADSLFYYDKMLEEIDFVNVTPYFY
jgi:hypothetical protein